MSPPSQFDRHDLQGSTTGVISHVDEQIHSWANTGGSRLNEDEATVLDHAQGSDTTDPMFGRGSGPSNGHPLTLYAVLSDRIAPRCWLTSAICSSGMDAALLVGILATSHFDLRNLVDPRGFEPLTS